MEYVEAAGSALFAAVSSAATKSVDPADTTASVPSPSDEDFLPHTDSPVWIFGKDYSAHHDRDELLELIRSRFWFSYRKDFPEIGESGFTSDRGWGCMLRCGQMVLAEALLRLHLGREWRWRPGCIDDERYAKIVDQFEDDTKCKFGIHRIALMGESEEGGGGAKAVGTWFGPNTVAQVLRKLSAEDSDLLVHVAMDNTIIIDEIKAAATADAAASVPAPNVWKPLLLFVPLRLGLTEVNPLYFADLKECFEIPQSVGVIGGRPNHALYFVGYADDELIHLDPHVTQNSNNNNSSNNISKEEHDATFHIDYPGRLDINQLDPSLALCFFCETEESFDSLCDRLLNRLVLGHTSPLFEICRQRPSHMTDYYNAAQKNKASKKGADFEKDTSDDEFEIL